MVEWLEWARGPVFRFALVFMLLGIVRLLILSAVDIYTIRKRAGDTNFPWRRILAETGKMMSPFNRPARQHPIFAILSMVFHVAMIVTPIFLLAHVMLWERGIGLSWPALGNTAADYLTLVGIITGTILLAQRTFTLSARSLSRPQDFALPVLLVAIFASGYLAAHPAINPFTYTATMFIHVMAGNLALAFLPLSKLSHVILFPVTQLISEMGWHLAADSGQKVALALHKEKEPV